MKVHEFVKIFPLVFGTGASLLTGCDVNKKIEESLNNNKYAIEDMTKEEDIDVSISKEIIINKYQNYFNEEIEYRNKDLYLKEDDIDTIINNSTIRVNNNYQFDGNIDNIISNIKNNSSKVDSEDLISAFNEDNGELLQSILSDVFNDIIKDNNNLNSDFHILNDLKIVTYSDNSIENFVSAYLDETNTIVINYNEIKVMADYYKMSFKEQVTFFITKEINTVRKFSYENDVESTLNYKGTGDSLVYDGTNSIELIVKNRVPINNELNNDFIYTSEMKAQGELLLLGIANQDKDILNKYFNAVNDNNVKELWSIYNLNSKNDIKRYYNILYSMDAKLYRNTLINAFYDSHKNISYIDFVGLEYKLDLYNKCVNNLFEFQKEQELSLQDNIVLYSIILNAIVNDAYKYENNTINYNLIFMDKINELNEYYLEYLSSYYNVDRKEIDDLIKYDTRFILLDMASIMHHDDDGIPEFNDEAQRMLNKYPLTKAIMASDYIYTTQFDKAYKNAKERTLSL